MSEQRDAFNKAAECERLVNLETDEVQRTAYRALRDMWISLANECVSMTPGEFVRQLNDLDQIQTGFQERQERLGAAVRSAGHASQAECH